MNKQDRKTLKENLIIAIKKQLLENNAEIAGKFDKVVKKSIKQILKKAHTRKALVAAKIIETPKAVKASTISKSVKKIKKSKVS